MESKGRNTWLNINVNIRLLFRKVSSENTPNADATCVFTPWCMVSFTIPHCNQVSILAPTERCHVKVLNSLWFLFHFLYLLCGLLFCFSFWFNGQRFPVIIIISIILKPTPVILLSRVLYWLCKLKVCFQSIKSLYSLSLVIKHDLKQIKGSWLNVLFKHVRKFWIKHVHKVKQFLVILLCKFLFFIVNLKIVGLDVSILPF